MTQTADTSIETKMVVTFGPCVHQWSYAPTVGNLTCCRCRERREFDHPDTIAYVAKYHPSTPQTADTSIEWIEWQGGKCPVAHGTMVQVRARDAGYSPYNSNPAGVWDFCEPSCWADNGMPDDIISYRVVAL
jgi:hypothetical protein